jgi:hypothetical protein
VGGPLARKNTAGCSEQNNRPVLINLKNVMLSVAEASLPQ